VSVTAAGGSASQTFTNDSSAPGVVWEPFSFSFTANGTATTISLVAQSTAGGSYIGLDRVDLEPGGGFLPADFNDSGKVDFADLLILAQHYGIKDGGTHATGDANLDRAVNFADLLILAQEYGQSSTGAAVAPEPSWIAAMGAAILLGRRRH
jgi:hypothetical protein